MQELRLVVPSKEHESRYHDMMDEWEAFGGRINPGALKRNALGYDRWLELIAQDRTVERTIAPACSGLVPQDLYFTEDASGRLVGAVSIRHRLNEKLFNEGGHIGYGIRPSERGKGYGKEQLRLAFNICRRKAMGAVLVTCEAGNLASAGVVLANGGVEAQTYARDDGSEVRRFWVALGQADSVALVESAWMKSRVCELVLRALPDWFGVPEAVDGYIAGVAAMPFWAAYGPDGDAVGFIAVKEHNEHTAEIYVMGILAEHHRKGIGRSLVENAVRFCRQTGRRYLTVKTLDESNPDEHYARTRMFYSAMGFIPLEVFPTLWDERNPCLFMVKEVSQ